MTGKEKKYWVKMALICGSIMLVLAGVGIAIVFGVIKASGITEPLGERFDDPVFAAQGSSSASTVYLSSNLSGKISISSSYFNGVKDVTDFSTEEEKQVEILHTQMVEEGRLKLVLILPDDTVIDLTGEGSPYTFHAPPGESRVRVIGDRTKFKLKVEIVD